MRFKILESSEDQLDGIVEGSNLEDIVALIGGKYGIRSTKLKATYELQDDQAMICVVRAGQKKMVLMKPLKDE